VRDRWQILVKVYNGFRSLVASFIFCSNLPTSKARVKRYLENCYKKLPFALPTAGAQKQLAARAEKFSKALLRESVDEPSSAKRIVK